MTGLYKCTYILVVTFYKEQPPQLKKNLTNPLLKHIQKKIKKKYINIKNNRK